MPSTGVLSLLLALFAPLALLGCPPAPPPLDQASSEVAAGEQPPPAGADATPPPAASDPSGLPLEPDALTFDRYLDPKGATVTIHGVVHGISTGQVDFTVFEDDVQGKGRPEAIHVQHFKGGTFEVTAPAGFARPLFVTAFTLDEDGRPDAQLPQASLALPLVIGQENLSITLEPGAPGVLPPSPDAAPLPAVEPPTAGAAPVTG